VGKIPDAILQEALAHEYREYGNTQGSVLAAFAALLAPDVKEAKKWEEYWRGARDRPPHPSR
jgi:hypothetical protein